MTLCGVGRPPRSNDLIWCLVLGWGTISNYQQSIFGICKLLCISHLHDNTWLDAHHLGANTMMSSVVSKNTQMQCSANDQFVCM